MLRLCCLSLGLALAIIAGPAAADGPPDAAPVDWTPSELPVVPDDLAELDEVDLEATRKQLAVLVDHAWHRLAPAGAERQEILTRAIAVCRLKAQMDRRIEQLLELRTEIGRRRLAEHAPLAEARDPAEPAVARPAEPAAERPTARAAAADYLPLLSAWVQAAGRLRYLTFDLLDAATLQLDASGYRTLARAATEHGVATAGSVLSFTLIEPPPEDPTPAIDPATREAVLRLIRETNATDALGDLAEVLAWPHTPPRLKLQIAEAIRAIGLPQPAEGADAPLLKAEELRRALDEIDPSSLDPAWRDSHAALRQWIATRLARGVAETSYRWAGIDLRPGDWVLVRNPSPYNRFTDLSPGLFTHVGIVAAVSRPGGRTEMVVVDLPERGASIAATPADAFLRRTLHWMVLRHRDADAAARMAEIAAALIGRPAEFDLTFNTSLVAQQRGIVEGDAPVRTYCAGFLALCAQEAEVPRAQLFPLIEHPSTDRCAENLQRLGLRFTDFVSPTGALFSPHLEIVGRREPLVTPDHEIAEAIYDHFADSMARRPLHVQATGVQRIRQQLVELGTGYQWVREALAKANNISPEMDLIAAARVATAIENLDRIAEEASQDFRDAQLVIPNDGIPEWLDPAVAERLQARLPVLQSRHASLLQDWKEGELTFHQLQRRLVAHYVAAGREQVDHVFFSGAGVP